MSKQEIFSVHVPVCFKSVGQKWNIFPPLPLSAHGNGTKNLKTSREKFCFLKVFQLC